jgi:GTP-sensing pleiotropic transcriptional regulator CodY
LIITKKDYREDYTKIFKKDVENLNHLIKYANIVDNVTDLLSLSLCKFLVEAPLSSWSSFAKVYGNKESIKSNLLLKKLKDKKFYNEMEEIVNRPIPNIL